MTCQLAQKKCIPCTSGTPPLDQAKQKALKESLHEAWEIVDNHHLYREFKFTNFKEALVFTHLVGNIADREDHHPHIALSWGKATITLWTHKIGGLSESDFILAAKIDAIDPSGSVCY